MYEKGNKKHIHQQQHTTKGCGIFPRKVHAVHPLEKAHNKRLWNLPEEGSRRGRRQRLYLQTQVPCLSPQIFYRVHIEVEQIPERRTISPMNRTMRDNPRSQKFHQNFCVERCASSHPIGATPAMYEMEIRNIYISNTTQQKVLRKRTSTGCEIFPRKVNIISKCSESR